MLRRALVLTTALVAMFFLIRWAFVGGEESVAASTVQTGPMTATTVTAGAAVPGAVEPVASAPMPLAEGQRLLGHRAIYDLRLGESENGSGVAVADGRMVIEFTDTCDGYSLNQRLQMRLGDGEGGATVTDFRVANWEATDGKRFRFAVRHIVNGEEDEVFEGSAQLGPDGSGEAHYTKPEDTVKKLPAGTLFPSMHTIQLIRAAQASKPILAGRLFDGAGEELTYDVVGAIGRSGSVMPVSLKGKGLDLLRDLQSWPVRIAFYPTGSIEELPEYEIGFRLYGNGVSSDMQLDYGDFSIDAVLSELDALPKPDC
jgi:hypothetical protein